jgi:catechol 2,3-dioxygenase-like lactoylglutathione lyase family enzyme
LQGEALQEKERFMPDYTFEHLHLISEDPQKTADFYTKYMGAQVINIITTPSGAKAVRLKIKDSMIIISPKRANNPFLGLEHFGMITDNLSASLSELQLAGCTLQGEPQVMPNGTRIAFILTPEKVMIELLEYAK